MKFFRHLLILCFLFIIPWTHSELFKLRNFSRFHRKMESISMESCISGKLNPVVISNDIRNVIGESLWTKEIIPTISIAENFGISNDSVISLPKFPTYILSTNELRTVLKKIKSLPWWNIKSYFFIVEVSRNCNDNDAWKILQVMWKMNLLSSLFICRNIDNTITLYTYNPYANYAPHPWQHVKTIFKEQDQQWTLFKKLDSSGRHGCNESFFDKTKLLNGYKVVAIRPFLSGTIKATYNVDSIRHKMPYLTSKTFKEIFSALNVRPIIHYSDKKIGTVDVKAQTLEQLHNDMFNDKYDIVVMYDTIVDDVFEFLYPRTPEIFLITTYHNKIPLFLDSMESVFSIEVIILIVIVFVITWIVFKLSKRLSIGSGLLEILRLVLSTSILLKFYKSSLRIFLVSILIFVIFMNNIYQGFMSAYSTKFYQEEINSVTDLQNLKYTMHMKPYVAKVFGVDQWTDTQKKYVKIHHRYPCNDFIRCNNSRSACLVGHGFSQWALNGNFHIILYPSPLFYSPSTRRDWPLKPRVDHIMSKLSAGGFIRLWNDRGNNKLMTELSLRKSAQVSDLYRPIVMPDLYSIFLFLVISLSISILVFIGEVSIPRLRLCMK